MVLNIFPRKREPAELPAPEPEFELPEPSPEAMADIEQKKRTRRGTRGGRGRKRTAEEIAAEEAQELEPTAEEQAEAEPVAEAQPEQVPEPEEAPKPARRTRTRAAAAATAEPATAEADAEAAPETKPAPRTRRTTAKAAAATEPAAEPAAPSENGTGAKRKAPAAAKETAAPAYETGITSILHAIEKQQREIEQLTRLQEDMSKRLSSSGGGAAKAPPARVGVFVDAANIELASDRLRARFDWKKILDLVTKDRQLIRAIAYSPVHDDPGVSIETQRFVEPFLDKGFKVVTKPLKRFQDGTIKANVDIEMALDVIEMLDRLDVVVLVSGDGDFQRLVEVVQKKGVRVEVVAVAASTASHLRHAADQFIDLQARLREVRA